MKRALLALVVACGPRHVAPQVDWSQPPQVVAERPMLPVVVDRQIAGLRVVVIENHRLPLVTLAAVSTSAGGRAGWKSPGVATLTTELVAASVRDFVPERSVATEYAALELTVRTEDLEAAADQLVEALRKPKLDDKTLAVVREPAIDSARMHDDSTRSIAGRVLDRIVFGGHPYEVPAEGVHDAIARLTTDDVRTFWQAGWAPGTVTLVIVGDIDAARVAHIAQRFASLAGTPQNPERPPLPAYTAKLGVVDFPGATKSVVLVGRRSERAGEQQLAGDVANLLLGGGPDSRLDLVLHDKLRVTLGAGSSYWRGRLAGSWSIAASFPVDRTAEGLRATLDEIKRARDELPTAADVARAKATLLRALAASVETNLGATRVLERMIGQGLPSDWYATYIRRLDAITPEDVHRAAGSWDDLSIVIVGDWQKLRGELTSFGLPVTMYEP